MRVFFFLFFIFSLPIFASSNLELTAEKALEWQIGSRSVVAIGAAHVVYEDTEISAEKITGFYTEKGSDKNFFKLVAQGHVKIKNPSFTIDTESLTYDLNQNLLLLKGSPWTRLTHLDSILSSALPMTFNTSNHQAVLKQAEIKHQNRLLTAPSVVAYFSAKNDFQRVHANGGIVLKTEQETLTSATADYDVISGIATLSGPVTLTRKDGSVLKGGKLVYDMKKGMTRLEADSTTGSVLGIFKK